jgi:hypothetical protein
VDNSTRRGVSIRYKMVQAASNPSAALLQLRLVASDSDTNTPCDMFPDPGKLTGRRTVRVHKEVLLMTRPLFMPAGTGLGSITVGGPWSS